MSVTIRSNFIFDLRRLGYLRGMKGSIVKHQTVAFVGFTIMIVML
jgi:hypothetical protein